MKSERHIRILAEEYHKRDEQSISVEIFKQLINKFPNFYDAAALSAMQRVEEECEADLTRLRECEAIVRALSNVGYLAFPQHNPHIMDIIDKAREWVRKNDTNNQNK